jgi:hypothetical protein
MRTSSYLFAILLIALFPALIGCPPNRQPKPPNGVGNQPVLGRLMFDAPVAFTEVGTLDLPRLARLDDGETHLVYLKSEGQNQRVMYTRAEGEGFGPAGALSQDDGRKPGGAFITSRTESSFIAYWANIPTSGGQLMYKQSENSGASFDFEKQWNRRGEVRWPCVLTLGPDVLAYFFVKERDTWELAVNRNFSAESEPTVDTAQGDPYHLQGVTDGARKVWLAYFVRVENSDGGRIAYLSSDDGGATFTRNYMFDDKVIPSAYSYFSLARSVHSGAQVLHLIFTEETPELTTIYYSRSEDGVQFSLPVALMQSEEPLTRSPLLTASGAYVLVATADTEEDGPAIRYVLSEDGGKSFAAPAIATREVGNAETIAGLIDNDGRAILVWDDLAKDNEEGEQLYRLKGILRGQ